MYLNDGTGPDPGAGGSGGGTQVEGTPAPWYSGADADVVAHLQNRGWDKVDAKTAALSAAKAHSHVEKMVGVPDAEILRLPKNPSDENGWKAVYSKLGKPAEPKEYDFTTVKFADGSDLDEGFADFLRNTAYNSHLSKEAATRLASELVKHMDQIEASESASTQATVQAAQRKLRDDWGNNFENNLFIARKGAEVLGVDPETVQSLEKVAGYDKVMELFRKVGVLNKEDAYIRGSNPTGGGFMTKAQAQGRIAELKADPAWQKRYFEGGSIERREMDGLTAILAAGQTFDPQKGY